ncbi:phosphatase PAP2 family protein [Shewanella maritima]|uniref:phosphatase PAP2 family protein n=1 Tax=Shewanella maritima TaxID=2520507 RepID=UPI003735066E
MPHIHTPKVIPFNRNVLVCYGIALLCVCGSIFWLDTKLATWLHQHVQPNWLLKLLSQAPILLESIAAMLIVLPLLMHFWPRLSTRLNQQHQSLQFLAKLLVMTIVLATFVRVSAKFIFGRTWPETWTNDNPSWIAHSVMEFHPFSSSLSFHSFPSGHALFTFALASIFWRCIPQYRLLWLACMLTVLVGQLGQNYHYLGDVMAGATLGLLVAQCSHHLINQYFVK